MISEKIRKLRLCSNFKKYLDLRCSLQAELLPTQMIIQLYKLAQANILIKARTWH